MKKFVTKYIVGSAVALFIGVAAASTEALPEYQKTEGISGNLSSVGSDTLANLMTLWAEEFKHQYPNVNFLALHLATHRSDVGSRFS